MRELRSFVSLLAFLAPAFLALGGLVQGDDNFKKTHSRKPYVHHIELYDANGRVIDPRSSGPAPYSPRNTCKKCHDYAAISGGHHFNASAATKHGRPGEPWILVDERTGTQLPISLRGWAGTVTQEAAGLTPTKFLQTFGRHLPGGGATYAGTSDESGRLGAAGELEIDCMSCHTADRSYSHVAWAKSVAELNFAWAATVAAGLGSVEGSVKSLPEDFDITSADAKARLPKTTYDARKFSAKHTVFFDVVRTPESFACYACHTTRTLGDGPRWNHDGDVHLRAGMSCSDCHPNGIAHHTVRGYEGEENPATFTTKTLSCRGCHMDAKDATGAVTRAGGRFGAPKPLHPGLPPLHLEKLACTVCHSGPVPASTPHGVQTSFAHALGIPSQTRTDEDLPRMVAPVFVKNDSGVIEPHRQVWPAFWGRVEGDSIVPIAPGAAYPVLRKTLRVRHSLAAKLGDAVGEGLARALTAFTETGIADPVYVAGGRAYRLGDGSGNTGTSVEAFDHDSAAPVRWPLAHDVRPARHSLGASGCSDCHSRSSQFMHGEVIPLAPIVVEPPTSIPMSELMQQDPTLLAAWEASFSGRSAFRWIGFVSVGCLALVIAAYGLLLLGGLRSRAGVPAPEETKS